VNRCSIVKGPIEAAEVRADERTRNGQGAESLAEDEHHLAEGVPGGCRFQIRPQDIEDVFAAGASAGERVQVDEQRDWLPGAEHGGVGVANIQADAP
jgi:hypothetical protein